MYLFRFFLSLLLCIIFIFFLFYLFPHSLMLFFFFLIIRQPPRSTRTDTLFPYTTLFRSSARISILPSISTLSTPIELDAYWRQSTTSTAGPNSESVLPTCASSSRCVAHRQAMRCAQPSCSVRFS